MKLYRISQNTNNGWDTYDSAIICAESEEDARSIHPHDDKDWGERYSATWTSDPKFVEVEYIGEAREGMTRGVVLASFNAG